MGGISSRCHFHESGKWHLFHHCVETDTAFSIRNRYRDVIIEGICGKIVIFVKEADGHLLFVRINHPVLFDARILLLIQFDKHITATGGLRKHLCRKIRGPVHPLLSIILSLIVHYIVLVVSITDDF